MKTVYIFCCCSSTIESCCLKEDLNEFEYGEQTLIGDNGITLSGGQKVRLALARAVYQVPVGKNNELIV